MKLIKNTQDIANFLGIDIKFNNHIKDFQIDSRQVTKNSLFFGLQGSKEDGSKYKTKHWRTNESYLHFVIAHYESEKLLSKMYDDYCKKYDKRATSNIVKTLARGYSEAMLDAEKRDVIISWSIPVEPLPKLK